MKPGTSIGDKLLVRLYVIFIKAVQRRRYARLIRGSYRTIGRFHCHMARTRVPAATGLPRLLWLYWHQGEEQAPKLVAQCLQTWRDLNSNWKVRVLHRETLREHISVDDLPSDITLQALSDVIRLRLLRKYGGVWVDATAYCVRPLEDWLLQLMASGFFAFTLPAHDRLIGSWFLAACEGSPLIKTWESAATRYWRVRRRADAYFWVHYLFEFVTFQDPVAEIIWSNTPIVDSRDCWRVFAVLRTEQSVQEYRALAYKSMAEGAPFQRLSHKHGLADQDAHKLMKEYLRHGDL